MPSIQYRTKLENDFVFSNYLKISSGGLMIQIAFHLGMHYYQHVPKLQNFNQYLFIYYKKTI